MTQDHNEPIEKIGDEAQRLLDQFGKSQGVVNFSREAGTVGISNKSAESMQDSLKKLVLNKNLLAIGLLFIGGIILANIINTHSNILSQAWGPASSYKFGKLPNRNYPDTCAFSQTDSNGETVISRSNLEYWACKDEGGTPEAGFSVLWLDGKRTKYKFNPGGSGLMVGTNGETYPISWQSDIRNNTNIIIITHESGSISWIPGHAE